MLHIFVCNKKTKIRDLMDKSKILFSLTEVSFNNSFSDEKKYYLCIM